MGASLLAPLNPTHLGTAEHDGAGNSFCMKAGTFIWDLQGRTRNLHNQLTLYFRGSETLSRSFQNHRLENTDCGLIALSLIQRLKRLLPLPSNWLFHYPFIIINLYINKLK